jgi:hypothetical protein
MGEHFFILYTEVLSYTFQLDKIKIRRVGKGEFHP